MGYILAFLSVRSQTPCSPAESRAAGGRFAILCIAGTRQEMPMLPRISLGHAIQRGVELHALAIAW